MTVIWILFVCSVILLPATALLALHWAMRQGEFKNLSRTALSIFDDEEPVGRLSDSFPGRSDAFSTATPSGSPSPKEPDCHTRCP
jgi:nitrogen fixation-related uncharacterized protein